MAKDQQEWYRKFYEGTFFIKGWKSRKMEMLKALSPEKREELADLLENVGQRIGVEWAREDDARKIDNARLQAWGKELGKAMKQGPDAMAARILRLRDEVDELLGKRG